METIVNKIYKSPIELCIRVKKSTGLPGEDITTHNVKIGSSLRNGAPLSGLTHEEERKYLPAIINISPQDVEWRRSVAEYWNNISVVIPPDGVGTDPKRQGKLLNFTVGFNKEQHKKDFDNCETFEEKAEFLKKIELTNDLEIIDGLSDYILFRYSLVYNKVANSYRDINKSRNILFYLYSKSIETKNAHKLLQLQVKAGKLFNKIFTDVNKINAILRMFNQNPNDFDTIEDKHIVLNGFVSTRAKDFITFAGDENLKVKSLILEAVATGIIYNPANTDSYYFGANSETTLGTSLTDAVLYLKSDIQKNKEILDAIQARVKESRNQ